MAWTQLNLDDVEAAIIALATGQRVARVTLEGKSVEFDNTSVGLERLQALRAMMMAALESVPLRTYAKNAGRGL